MSNEKNESNVFIFKPVIREKVRMTEGEPLGTISACDLGEPQIENMDRLFNLRDWLKNCLEKNGAEVTGSGIGFGEADVSIKLDGMNFWVTIKPT